MNATERRVLDVVDVDGLLDSLCELVAIPSIAADHVVVETLSGAWGDISAGHARVLGMTYGADVRLLVNEGQTPTLMFGPGDIRRRHSPNEYVPLSELVACTWTLVLGIQRFCGNRPIR